VFESGDDSIFTYRQAPAPPLSTAPRSLIRYSFVNAPVKRLHISDSVPAAAGGGGDG